MALPKSGIFQLSKKQRAIYVQKRKPRVCVIGLGRVGLPAAVAFAIKGFYTIGVDINRSLVYHVNTGKLNFIDEPGLGKLLKRVKKGFLNATTNIRSAIAESEIILLCLPTPLNIETKEADYSHLESACKEFSSLNKGSMICVESTVSPGIVENLVIPLIEKVSGLRAGIDFGIASCPERVNPSSIARDLYNVPRVIGGMNDKSTDLAAFIYEKVFGVEITRVRNCMTANASKLAENVFRYVNIAYVTELALLFERMGIDVREVVKACATKYNFVPHYPGVGVGGSCLPVNTYQLLHTAAMSKADLHLLDVARRINENMPLRIVQHVEQLLSRVGKSLTNSTVTVLGVTYKPNVTDTRISPVEVIIRELKDRGAKVKVYDPFVEGEIFSCRVEKDYAEAVDGSDVIVIGTPHDKFRNMNFKVVIERMNSPVIFDPTGFLAKKLRKYKVTYDSIGEDP
ncbi:MAG: nucleotide sugar dehydrogenase [Nitrososphaerales archaeon]